MVRGRRAWSAEAQDAGRALAESDPKYPALFRATLDADPARPYEIREHVDACFTCVTRVLSLERQMALLLAEVVRLRIREIARVLERPPGTIKQWLLDARKELRSIFADRCALISKSGVCDQCSELNGWFNPDRDAAADRFCPRQSFLVLPVSPVDPVARAGVSLHCAGSHRLWSLGETGRLEL